MAQRDVARRLVERQGSTYAERAGFGVTDPCVDEIAAKGARRLGLSPSPSRLAALVPEKDLTRVRTVGYTEG